MMVLQSFLRFIITWTWAATFAWFFEWIGDFHLFELDTIGLAHLTWPQRFGVALLLAGMAAAPLPSSPAAKEKE